jgi:uncharacterized protein YdhG (YjbR/CyaY superfamily)
MAMLKENKPQSIDAYIALQEAFMRPKLEQIRKTISKAAPDAVEIISYSMPAYKYHGMLVYFAAFKNHMGFYTMKDTMVKFKDKIEPYQSGMATLQFLWDKPLPVKLVSEIVKYRAHVNMEKKLAKEAVKRKKK